MAADMMGAMKKKLGAMNPDAAIEHGIRMLDHPDLKLSPKDKMHVAAFLHGAKHFKGPHPKIFEYTGGMDEKEESTKEEKKESSKKEMSEKDGY